MEPGPGVIWILPIRVQSKEVSRLGITMAVSIGIAGIGEIRPGTHICALYSSPAERDNLLFPFLREGIREGDKCLCLIDDAEPTAVRDQVEQKWNDHGAPRSEQLDVDRASDVYLRAGRFSVDHMVSFLSGSLSRATESDFPRLRAAGEMSWVLPQPGGAEDFFVYESAVNKIVEDKPAVFMCMYDLQRFGVRMLVDVLKTHPKVLLDSTVLENPNFLTPQQDREVEASSAVTNYPLATVSKRRTGLAWSDPWRTLTDAELRIAELVAGGLTNRNIAEYLNLSPHTVDAHLKHTYTKLNIHSRVELTVLALQHR
jgi:DNA-binding CsgD family transcriptional regulator